MLYESNILQCCFRFPVVWIESFIKARYAELQQKRFEHCSDKYLQCSVTSFNMYIVVLVRSAGSTSWIEKFELLHNVFTILQFRSANC